MDKKKHPTPFLAANQLPGDFRPLVFDEHAISEPDPTPNSYEQPITHQKTKIIIYQQQSPTAPPPSPSPLKIEPVHQYYQPYITEDPPNYVTPSPDHNSDRHPAPIPQPLYQSRPRLSPISHQQQGPVRTNQQQFHAPEKESRPSPATIFKSSYYNNYDYGLDLDPDDGYGSKIPMQYFRHSTTTVRLSPIEHDTEPTPIIASPTPFQVRPISRPQINPFEHQSIPHKHYSPSRKPASRPTAIPQPVHQHLTETTHLHLAPVQPYHHSPPQEPDHHQSVQYHNHQYPTSQPKIYSQPQIPATTTIRYDPAPAPPPSHQHNPDYDHVLHKLQQTHLLPETLNAGNFEGSIQQLVAILNGIKQQQQQHHISEIPSQHVGEDEPSQHAAVVPDEEEGHKYAAGYPAPNYNPIPQQQQPPSHHHPHHHPQEEEPLPAVDGPKTNHHGDHDNGDYEEDAYPDEKEPSGL